MAEEILDELDHSEVGQYEMTTDANSKNLLIKIWTNLTSPMYFVIQAEHY